MSALNSHNSVSSWPIWTIQSALETEEHENMFCCCCCVIRREGHCAGGIGLCCLVFSLLSNNICTKHSGKWNWACTQDQDFVSHSTANLCWCINMRYYWIHLKYLPTVSTSHELATAKGVGALSFRTYHIADGTLPHYLSPWGAQSQATITNRICSWHAGLCQNDFDQSLTTYDQTILSKSVSE